MIKNNTVKFRGVLFDFDGVLADTMRDHFAAWNYALGRFDAAVAADIFYALEGMPVALMAQTVCERAGVGGANAEEILRVKEEYYLSHNHFSLYPGVEEYITLFRKKNVPMAIVSGGRLDRIQKSTPQYFLSHFDAVVTGEQTARGKPFPDAYLEGARRLGIDAESCIVVENAPLGVSAAKGAGAYCIAITSTMPRLALKDADEVVDSFEALMNTIPIGALLA
ncbi:MAG: HAD family phosphatase [Candidatus Sungbacteria bacterium]|nr:HAD family phosphatase [Candidatus Sungbacteria bacterium]